MKRKKELVKELEKVNALLTEEIGEHATYQLKYLNLRKEYNLLLEQSTLYFKLLQRFVED